MKSELFEDKLTLEAQAIATGTVEPIKVTEDPLDKNFTTVTSKFTDGVAVKAELRKAAAPSEYPTLAMWGPYHPIHLECERARQKIILRMENSALWVRSIGEGLLPTRLPRLVMFRKSLQINVPPFLIKFL